MSRAFEQLRGARLWRLMLILCFMALPLPCSRPLNAASASFAAQVREELPMNSQALIRDFWGAPPIQLDRKNLPAACSDEDLDAREKVIGFSLPRLLREQYKVQNGGYPRLSDYLDASRGTFMRGDPDLHAPGGRYGVFVNGAIMSPLGGEPRTFRSWLREFLSDAEIDERFSDWKLERIVILSFMWGHSLLFLDYGYRGGDVLDPPQVVLMDGDDFGEEIRAASWESFVASLTAGEDAEEDAAPVTAPDGPHLQRDFTEFSVDLPSGWGLAADMEPRRSRWGIMGSFVNADAGCAMTVSVVSSMGKNMDQLVADALRKGGDRVGIVERNATRVEYEVETPAGRARLVSVLDPEAEQVGILSLLGESEACARAAGGVKLANPRLRFF